MWDKLIKPVADLASEFIEDKDKRNEFISKSEQLMVEAVNSAREHDKASYGIPFVDAVRGLVRPVITFTAMGWYVYARAIGIELGQEDYFLIGGVMAFWFGSRLKKS